ncbi:MAG TPA: XRE family transcriptional regulator [Spirochaetota bacterium]|nr:XRE family transcriptional regulator [Spirochaetota bacterium]HRZ28614.1 XRE family transcriptional regulator [Spirochaetota bacterium]HSA14156.1 XRE family transcriptional regulator [Spirochaetota bacterium]
MISTGVSYLDKLTGGLRLGDNVVWQVANGVSIDSFIRAFIDHNKNFEKNIIYINSNYSPHTIKKRYGFLFNENTTLIDAFTHGKGNSDEVFLDFYRDGAIDPAHYICMENPRDISSFIGVLNEVEKTKRDGSFYIFDSLTGLFELWKNERDVIDFFAFKCPKLYDMNTLAFWIYERDAHSKEFMASITHITQVIFALDASHMDYYRLNINKLENRPSFHAVEPHYFRIIDNDIRFQTSRADEIIRVGEKVKKLRKEKEITQSELADVLGLTAGAVSQIENNVTSPSLQTLVQMASFFNRPLEFFISTGTEQQKDRGYTIARKNKVPARNIRNVHVSELFKDEKNRIIPHSLTIGPNSIVEGPLLLHKGSDFITVTSGSIEVLVNDSPVLLKKGDSIMLESAFVTRWKTFKEECELLYILLN